MKFGVIFPTTEIGNDPIVIRDWAQCAEGLGYDHILFYDHVLGAEHADREPPFMGPYTEDDPFHEVMVTMGYLAGVTTKIEFCTGILILPQRQAALVAKQAAEVSVLSGGRLRLGLGTGWNHIEYESLGMSWADRGMRLDEQVEVLHSLWREPVQDFKGKYHRIDRAGILPAPAKSIPLWFGGFGEPAARRAARVGDGFIYATSPTRVQPLYLRIQELLAAEGRDSNSFGHDATVDFSRGESHWRKQVDVWRDLGGSHISLRAMDNHAVFVGEKHYGFDGPQSYLDAMETFMKVASS
jgi:probable F420-dependent oxidoreductase